MNGLTRTEDPATMDHMDRFDMPEGFMPADGRTVQKFWANS